MVEGVTTSSSSIDDSNSQHVFDDEVDEDMEMVDGYYLQYGISTMNEKVRLFADHCEQRDYDVKLFNDGNLNEAKAVLENWPDKGVET